MEDNSVTQLCVPPPCERTCRAPRRSAAVWWSGGSNTIYHQLVPEKTSSRRLHHHLFPQHRAYLVPGKLRQGEGAVSRSGRSHDGCFGNDRTSWVAAACLVRKRHCPPLLLAAVVAACRKRQRQALTRSAGRLLDVHAARIELCLPKRQLLPTQTRENTTPSGSKKRPTPPQPPPGAAGRATALPPRRAQWAGGGERRAGRDAVLLMLEQGKG